MKVNHHTASDGSHHIIPTSSSINFHQPTLSPSWTSRQKQLSKVRVENSSAHSEAKRVTIGC